MITPMLHATLICRKEDAVHLLSALREFAGMHLQLLPTDHRGIEERSSALKQLQQLLQKLERLEPTSADGDSEPEALLLQAQRLYQCIQRTRELDQKLFKEEQTWAPFGAIQTETLRQLKARGLNLEFYRSLLPPQDLPADSVWLPGEPGFGLALSLDSLEQVETPALNMPCRAPARIAQLRDHLQKIQQAAGERLSQIAAELPALRAYADAQADELDFLKAEAGMADEKELAWIEGFVPAELREELESAATRWGAAWSLREPGKEDPTPTLLKQNAFVSWIQPVFSFLGVTPGYQEVDVGWSFLIFLSVFSGMIIGDAGYGLLLLLCVAGLNLFKPATRGKFANLLLLMGAATVIWGLLTGNLFGISELPAFLDALKIPALADMSDPKPVMNVCFLMGAGHLTLAHLWNLWNRRKSLQALAEIGWIGSTWTMYAVTGQMVLGWESLPGFIAPLFGVSALLIVLFMTPPKALKDQWVDHMMLPLSFVNNFVDVVSYVRLYAVGMATFALASSFNSMILGGSEGRGLLANGIMMIILILGHALNFILAGMGVMVHGIRLNTLEFASHLGLTWSGIPYAPFKRRAQSSACPGRRSETAREAGAQTP
ncbi:MAG: V-type ATP synthase subunit I [Kiritimatiellia bacterium]